jgi:predicted transcriptional regulator of viral defense system
LAQSHTPPDLIPSPELPEALIAQGRYWATAKELRVLTGSTPTAMRQAAARLRHQRRMFSPAKGFYVMVPPEHRARGAVPAEWFIDPMMAYLERAYYVGFLTAAAMHGAAHQAPQTFQVVIAKYLADRDLGRVHMRFTASERVRDMAVEQKATHTGYFTLATRETTAVDLVWRYREGGGISNVATVLKELGQLDGDTLARLAPLRDRSTVRRLGWLLERYRPDVDLHWVRVVARPEEGDPILLSPSAPKRGRVDKRWGVVVNTTVEADV